MTRDEYDEVVRLVCPYCRQGRVARQRPDTREWVHDINDNNIQSHTICWATGLKNSRFASGWDESKPNG